MDVEELEVPTYSEDEAAFIASLESDSATFTDDTTEAASDALDMQGATATALMLLNTVEAITKQMAHPAFALGDAEKQATAEAVAPALAKNGGQLPEWLEPYKEEMIALFAVGSLAFGGYMQVKQLRELEAQQNKSQESVSSNELAEEKPIAA
ncbi:hypothetical protein BCT65_006305 [Vibrio splendidus]|uniref:hypothetical protein n=1 Tax=Vibrio splendidus TaxID=29497 RepID=UPI000C85906A|nr:hypothetical protein [Vibrio splendidus]MCC5516674.1 hypothetical protein [Vibrio splendidus]